MSRKKKARPAPPAAKPHWSTAAMWILGLLLWGLFLLDRFLRVDVPVGLLLSAIVSEIALIIYSLLRARRKP